MVPATAPAGPVRVIAAPVTGSLNVAVTGAVAATPAAPAAGARAESEGGVLSVAVVSKTTSTQ